MATDCPIRAVWAENQCLLCSPGQHSPAVAPGPQPGGQMKPFRLQLAFPLETQRWHLYFLQSWHLTHGTTLEAMHGALHGGALKPISNGTSPPAARSGCVATWPQVPGHILGCSERGGSQKRHLAHITKALCRAGLLAEVVSGIEKPLLSYRSPRKVGKGKKCSCHSSGKQQQKKHFALKVRTKSSFPLPAHWHTAMFKLL